MFSILFAEDDDQLRKTIVDYLRAKGIKVLPARNGSEAVDSFYDNDPDLIVLDVMMPIMNGTEVCRIIRRRNKTVPILFLTAMSQERDYLNGFKCGCDDYIVKPFPLSVLYEKCMNLIKRSKKIDSDNSLTVSGIRLDFNTYKAYADDTEIPLSGKDFKLLWYLMENKNIVLNRELILTHLWGYDFDGDTRVVDTHIKNLRKALGEKSSLIRTVVNIGYSFQEV
ncbi:MAG: response regulator transcription factor [Eubacterium sp.]|nr:response regulator transcription factor [Eubacterium sp.]